MAEQRLPAFSIRDFSAGQINSINENLRPRNSVDLAMNFNFDDELGSATTRLGTFIVGGQMVEGQSVLGIHQHTTPSASGDKLFSAINDVGGGSAVIYSEDGMVQQTGLTANRKVRFLTYLGETLAVNGVNANRAYNGSAWITTGGAFDLGDMPTGNSLCAEFLDRVLLAGDTSQPDRLYYSAVQASGAVAFEGDFVDIEPEDGGRGISALAKVPGYVLIFKKGSLHRFNFTTTFPESLVSIGTPSQECVISRAGICAFFSAPSRESAGFYVTNGGRPVPISHLTTKNIQKWVRAIPPDNYEDIAGWGDETHFFWSVGDITVDEQEYHNVVFRWSVNTGEWCIRTYPQRPTCGTSYLKSDGATVLVAGTDNGEVIEFDAPEVYTDYKTVSGEPGIVEIEYDLRTYRENFKFNQRKTISDRLVYDTLNGQGAVPYALVNGEFVFGESLRNDIGESRLPKNLVGNYFQFGLKGTVKGNRVVVKEIEVPNIVANLNYAS